MPARISARSSQSSAPSTKSRSSTATRSHGADDIFEDGPETSLRRSVCTIFAEAQASNNGQRKLIVRLRKIQESCCYETEQHSRNKAAANDEFDEHDFNNEIVRCVLRVLPVKKSEPVGDRIVRFLGVFLKQATDLDHAIFQQVESEQEAAVIPETPSSRLTSAIISLLVPILPSKDKVIRFRATQIVAHLINTLDSVDADLFNSIRLGLLKRLRDKETTVRVQAVYGLGRLAGEVDPNGVESDSDDDTAGGVLTKLLDVLQNDPSSDVRRALLLNLPFTPTTLPYLLERARDLDGSIRRALYSRLLPALGDFRHLSLTHREKLLRWGLRDRDENVRKATAKLFRERWIEDCACSRDDNGEPIPLKPGQVSDPSLEGLLELLERIDVVNAGNETGIASDAMREFWAGRPDYWDYITFDESFWKDLTAEGVFVARTFNDFCQLPDNKSLEDKMPEVTRFAFLLQENINKLVDLVQKSAIQEDSEEETVQQEFVVEQLLHIALTLDYSDEIGRRTMFSLMRGALALAELPEEATKLVIEVLRTTCGNNADGERELSGVVLEAIAEVHDNIIGEDAESGTQRTENDADDSFHSARSEISDHATPREKILDPEAEEERAIREIMVNMKCLHIAQCMLQNVECTMEQNPDIVTMLNNLVVPAVRSMEAPIRERGLLCLGLCCLLDKNLAEENLALFLKCFSKGHEALQVIAIQIIGDVLNAHPTFLMIRNAPSEGENNDLPQEPALRKDVHKLFSKSLKSPSSSVQSTACTALSKLMLSSPANTGVGDHSLLDHDDLLRQLAIAYFDPETAGNPALRQCLSYFLPVYCHSRYSNMQRMARIAMSVLHWCFGIKEEMDVDLDGGSSADLVGLNVVVSHLVDWTDGRRLAAALAVIGDESKNEPNSDVHLELAGEIIEKILGSCSKDERKLYLSMLSKLHVSPNSDSERLSAVLDLLNEAIQDKVAGDASARNVLVKMQNSINKVISSQSGQNISGSNTLPRTESQDKIEATRDSDETPHSAEDETPMPSPRKAGASPRKSKDNNPVATRQLSQAGAVNADAEAEGLAQEEAPTLLNIELPDRSKQQNSLDGIADRPKWQVSELEHQDFADDTSASPTKTEPADASKTEESTVSPTRRARPRRTSMQSGIGSVEPTPVPRQRARNVRASRRKEQSIVSITTETEDTNLEESVITDIN